MKNKLLLIIVALILLLNACSDNFRSNNDSREIVPESSNSIDERGNRFIENFSYDYPAFELSEYVLGSVENAPIQLVAIAKNIESGSSSTLFILDDNGVGQVVLASEYLATYRKEDGLQIDKNVISVSLDLKISDTNSEVHDFNITVTQKENQGIVNTMYSSRETIRDD